MKIALFVLALLFHCCMCYAQNEKKKDGPCADPACLQLPFPYWFCDDEGKQVVKCSKNPNNEPGLKFMKISLPIEFDYEEWTLYPKVTGGDDVIKFYQGTDTNFFGYPVFVNGSMRNIIAAAAKRWMAPNLCPPQGPNDEYVNCRIKIRWSFDLGEFEDGKGHLTPATTRRAYDPRACSLHCPSSLIILNQEPQYLQPDAYGRPTHFLLTERDNYYLTQMNPSVEYVYLDAYTTMVHEFGHLLGFAHTDQAPCGDPYSIMKSTWNGGEFGDLTWADECMFLKAYCCEKTQTIVYIPTDPCPNCPPEDHTKQNIDGSTDAGTDISFTAVPNPATAGTVTVTMHGTFTTGSARIRVADASGNIVLSQQIHDATNAREISVDVSSLSTGMYMLQLVEGGKTFSRKIIVAER